MIKHSVSVELQALALLSLPELSKQQVSKIGYLLEKTDFVRLAALVDYNRTHPCVYKNMNQYFKSAFPSNLFHTLQNKYYKNKYRNKRQLRVCADLSHRFKKSSINAHFFKGISLSDLLYKDIALRHNNDIDILIAPKDFECANKVLNSHGFFANNYFQLDNKWRKVYLQSHKDIVYTNKGGVIIELHFSLTIQNIKELSLYQVELCRRNTFIQSSTSLAELFYLNWHGAHTLFHRLKWLVDIKLYAEQLDEDIYKSCYFDDQCNRVMACGLYLVAVIYNQPMNDALTSLYMKDRVFRMMIQTCLNGLECPHYSQSAQFNILRHLFEILAFKNTSYMWESFLTKLRPTFYDIKDTTWLSPKLLFLYYPLRPFLALKRKFF